MPRRVSVPGAEELFRQTAASDQETERKGPAGAESTTPARTSSGRVRHDQKMTVYVTADELLDLEHARLSLRRAGLSVDRGRLVREAVALALADLERNGTDSEIAHRLADA